MRKPLLAATDTAMLGTVAAPSTLIQIAALKSPRLSRYNSSRADRIVCTALKITGLDRTAKVVAFAHVYRSLEGHIFRTGGIVLRQGDRGRIFLAGNTQRGAAMFTMALNMPPGQARSFDYMNGLVLGVNAPGNILAARVLCIPTHEERSARELHVDPRVGARPTQQVHAEIRALLPRLQRSEQDVVLESLANATGADEVLVLRHST